MSSSAAANRPRRDSTPPGARETATPALSVRGLTVQLRGRGASGTLLEGLDLDLPAGEITGLAGASGSGKTLTTLALMGLADPGTFRVRAQQVLLAGEPIDLANQRQLGGLRGDHMAMVFQDPATALDPVFTIGYQVAAPLRRRSGGRSHKARDLALAALSAVGFPEPELIAARYPHELSGGQRQRCVIAMAQALQPAVLFADEPTTALDTLTQQVVLAELDRLASECGTAILLVSHDLRLMAQHARSVLVMASGKIVEALDAVKLGTGARHPCTRRLVDALPRIPKTPDPPNSALADPSADQAMREPLLDIIDVTSGYPPRRALLPGRVRGENTLHGVSLSVYAGEIHGVAGESGCGKSTLARMLVQLLPVRSGSLRLDGEDLGGADREQRRRWQRRLQLVFQDPGSALSPRRTVAQTLSEAAQHFGRSDARPQLEKTLADVEMDAAALDRLPGQFSSGQRQRIALASALIGEPDLLIADEALSALDLPVQADILKLLNRLRTQRGLAILLISHDLALLRAHADTISVMDGGRIIEQGTPQALFSAPASALTRRLIAAIPRLEAG
ncbi:MAG: ABC transporter ATP-binding protein [Pseudomonadota bacterium]